MKQQWMRQHNTVQGRRPCCSVPYYRTSIILLVATRRRQQRQKSIAQRRHRQLAHILTASLRKRPIKKNHPRFWIWPRANYDWFRNDSGWWDDEHWIRNLRMTKSTFYKLVEILKPLIEKRDTPFRKAIPVDERVAVALYRLTTNMYYHRNIAQLFGRGLATCSDVTNEVIGALCRLKSDFIRWLNDEELQDIINRFHDLSKLPMVAGAVDGTHIPVLAPADQRNDYYCYKGYYSINLQAIVDFRGRFMNTFAGFPGRAHDARVFSSSTVFHKASSGTLFGDIYADINGIRVKPYLVGDRAYPLEPWLLKAYDVGELSEAEIESNICLNTARNVVERAFGRLKVRFRSLRKQIELDVLNAPDLITACCCLHNICEVNKEVFLLEWEEEAAVDDETLLIYGVNGIVCAKKRLKRGPLLLIMRDV